MKRIFWLLLILALARPAGSDQISGQHSLFGTRRTLVSVWHFNEGAGTLTKGYPPHSDGTLTNSPAWVNHLHGNGIKFLGGTDRVLFSTESDFDFIDVTSTFTIVIVYQMNSMTLQGDGKFIAKQNAFSGGTGWHFIASSVALGDFVFVFTDGATPRKIFTSAIPSAVQNGGRKKHVLIWDFSCQKNGATQAAGRMFLDGVSQGLSSDFGTYAVSIGNDIQVAAGNFTGGTGGGANFSVDMIAVYNGSGYTNLTEADARGAQAVIMGYAQADPN